MYVLKVNRGFVPEQVHLDSCEIANIYQKQPLYRSIYLYSPKSELGTLWMRINEML